MLLEAISEQKGFQHFTISYKRLDTLLPMPTSAELAVNFLL